MRIVVFFDLPVETAAERRAYRKFRMGLIRLGFMMFQKSVYVKLALNPTVQNSIMENVRRMKPESGTINMLCLTEKQFERIECVLGNNTSNLVDNTDRLVVL